MSVFSKKVQLLFLVLFFIGSLINCLRNDYPAANFYLLMLFINLYMLNEESKEK